MPATDTDKAIDPVCGMTVNPATAGSQEHEDASYYFCRKGCHDKFVRSPQRYLDPEHAAADAQAPAAPAGTIYTCPMDPEIRQEEPGSCPKCGMALEPESPTLDEGDNTELKDMTRRF